MDRYIAKYTNYKVDMSRSFTGISNMHANSTYSSKTEMYFYSDIFW